MSARRELAEDLQLHKMLSPLPVAEDVLAIFVHAAVGHFAGQYMEEHDPVFSQLHGQALLAKRLGLPPRSFVELLNFIHQHPDKLDLSAPFSRLVKDFSLNLGEVFILGLCAELENSYFLNLALVALQAPDTNSRPSLHLLSHILPSVFGVNLRPASFSKQALVHTGIVHLEGDGPLPMRKVALDMDLWQVLHNKDGLLPELHHLNHRDAHLLPESLQQEIPRLSAMLGQRDVRGIVFRGPSLSAESAACEIALQLGLRPVRMAAKEWQSNTRIMLAARSAQWLPVVPLNLGPADRFSASARTGVDNNWPVILTAGHEGSVEIDGLVEIDIPATRLSQRQTLWHQHVQDKAVADALAHSALLDGHAIQHIAEQAKPLAQSQQRGITRDDVALVRSRLGGKQLRQLAQAIVRHIDSEAVILPAAISEQFERLIQRCSRRESLWQGLGISASSSSNFGVRALFCGASGTGKTLSASYLASCLGAPLYRLDLALVMNKYIGETEKNLGLLLDEAAASDTILLLDEADALFGKRTEGDSAGDRFANMLTNFLLTRIEHHPGIVILTSNNQSHIDSAFMRRLDVVIEFPSPNAHERYLIWRSHLGERAPPERLCHLLAAYCDLPGGFIRNVVLNAAACEGDASQVLSVGALLDALKEEYRKLGRALPPSFDKLREQHG